MESITFNSRESKIIVTLDGDTEKSYTDAESYLADYPDRVGDVAVFDPPVPHVPTQDELVKAFKDAIQARLDGAAEAKGYDNIVSACSYAGYENLFQAEAVAFGKWRASVWAYGYAELDQVLRGKRSMPTVEQIVSELPVLVLP